MDCNLFCQGCLKTVLNSANTHAAAQLMWYTQLCLSALVADTDVVVFVVVSGTNNLHCIMPRETIST